MIYVWLISLCCCWFFLVSGVDPIGSLRQPGRAVVQGRLHTTEVRPVKHDSTVLACEVADSSGELTAVF